MKENDLHWLAGILEGEGCFYPQTRRYPMGISIAMTDEDIIKKVSEFFGTSYCKSHSNRMRANGWKAVYKTMLRGYPSLDFMKKVQPLMGERRQEKIEECIKSYSRKKIGKLFDRDKIYIHSHKNEPVLLLANKFGITKWRVYQIWRGEYKLFEVF